MHDASTEYLNLQNKDPDPSEIARIPQPEIVVREKLPEAPVPVSHEHSSASPAANLPDAQPEETRAQRRRRNRKRKEREREEQVTQAALEGKLKSGRSEMVAPQAGTGPSQAQPLPPKEPGGHEVAALQAEAGPSRAQRSSPNFPSNERGSLGSEASNSIMVTTSPPPPKRISSHRQGALAMTAGLVTEGVGCMPLDQSNTSSFESCP